MNTPSASPDLLPWLLDPADPGPRYVALRDLDHCPAGQPELAAARAAAHRDGPIAAVLAHMSEEGYWAKAGPGYGPKYQSTVWAIIALGQLGASIDADERVARGCAYLLDHALTAAGQFTYNQTPDGTFDCLQGNLLAALCDLGCDDPRLDAAFDWAARSVTGEGLAPWQERRAPLRYGAYKVGPLFRCRANDGLPCAWGAVKIMLAFGKLPPARHTPVIAEAIRQGREFLLGTEPTAAGWPSRDGRNPNPAWWRFGFPVFYVADLLQLAEALVGLGFGDDLRLTKTLTLIANKADKNGRWPLEHSYPGRMWPGMRLGRLNKPNKWVTIRALRVLEQSRLEIERLG